MHVLMAMSTTEVGVVTFSLTLKRRERMEKEQMSTPEPAMALKMPPRKPVTTSTTAYRFGESNSLPARDKGWGNEMLNIYIYILMSELSPI